VFILPYVLTGVSGLLIRSGLQASLEISRSAIVIGTLLLGAVCFLIVDFASYGLLAVVFAFLIAFATAIVALVVAIWLAFSLKGKRKTIAFDLPPVWWRGS
jgi:hypothetical protein